MKARTFMKFPECELHLHAHFQRLGIPVRRLIVNSAAPLKINNDQNVGEIEGKDGPIIKAEGKQLPLFVDDPDILKLIFDLAPHTYPLWWELDSTAVGTPLSITPE